MTCVPLVVLVGFVTLQCDQLSLAVPLPAFIVIGFRAPNLIDGEVADLSGVKLLLPSILGTPCNLSVLLVGLRGVVDVLQYPSLS